MYHTDLTKFKVYSTNHSDSISFKQNYDYKHKVTASLLPSSPRFHKNLFIVLTQVLVNSYVINIVIQFWVSKYFQILFWPTFVLKKCKIV